MKKLLNTLLLIFLFSNVFSQTIVDTFGMYQYGGVDVPDVTNIYPRVKYVPRGIRLVVTWEQLKPTKAGVYNWPILDSIVKKAVDSSLFFIIQTQTGQNAAPWLRDSSEIGRFFTDAAGFLAGPYPDYRNPLYRVYWYNFMDSVTKHFGAYSINTKKYMLGWHLSEGTTGDQFAYKGTPLPGYESYAWTEDEWTVLMKKPAWDTGFHLMRINSPLISLVLNTGNNGEDLEYVRERFSPYIMIKEGTLSHDIGFDGEADYYPRVTPASQGEAQGYILSDRLQHPHKEATALTLSALTGELKMFNLTQGWKNRVLEADETEASPFMSNLFNRYTQSVTTRGFAYFRDLPDLSDTFRFTTLQYGPLVTPDSLADFNKRIYSIINDSGYAPEFAAWRKQKVTGKWISAQRVANIVATFPQLQFRQYVPEDPGGVDGNDYNDDFGIHTIGNYHHYIYQLDAVSSSTPLARIGPDTAYYGRWAKKFKLDSVGMCTWKFDVDSAILHTSGEDTIQIVLTFYDTTASSSFSVNFLNVCDFTRSFTYTTTGTNHWKSIYIFVPGFRWREHGYDFTISYFSGAPTIFGMIDFENLSKRQ